MRIKEFTEMNEKLNLMKEQFKKEILSQQRLNEERDFSSATRLKGGKDPRKKDQITRNTLGIGRKSVQPTGLKDLDDPTKYIDVHATSKASRALPASILACRNSIQSLQAQSAPRRHETSMESSQKRLSAKRQANKMAQIQETVSRHEQKLTSTIKKIKIEKQVSKQKLMNSTTSLGLGQGTRNSYAVLSPTNQSANNLKDISFGKPS